MDNPAAFQQVPSPVDRLSLLARQPDASQDGKLSPNGEARQPKAWAYTVAIAAFVIVGVVLVYIGMKKWMRQPDYDENGNEKPRDKFSIFAIFLTACLMFALAFLVFRQKKKMSPQLAAVAP